MSTFNSRNDKVGYHLQQQLLGHFNNDKLGWHVGIMPKKGGEDGPTATPEGAPCFIQTRILRDFVHQHYV